MLGVSPVLVATDSWAYSPYDRRGLQGPVRPMNLRVTSFGVYLPASRF